MLKDYADVFEAARILGVHPETIRRLIRQGDIPAYKVANKWFVHRDQLVLFASYYDSRKGLQTRLF